MAVYQQRIFNPESKFKALRPFTMNGHQYGYDEPVDVTGIEVRRVRQMFDARLIDTDTGSATPPQKAAEPPKQQAQAKPVAAAEEAPAAASVRHKGFGRYEVVDAAGNTLATAASKEQAEEELKKHL
jgi:hypothetical protein